MKFIVQCHLYMNDDKELLAKILKVQNETRKESGCNSYLVCQEPTNTTHFLIVQNWDCKEQFESHLKTLHYKKFVDYCSTISRKPMNYEYFCSN